MPRLNPCFSSVLRGVFLIVVSLVACVSRIEAGPVFESIYGFTNAPSSPRSKLVQASDGSFYGTSYGGGASNLGSVFRIAPDGVMSVVVSFNGTNGANPAGGLVIAGDGNLYGTTQFGGAGNQGTVFRLTTAGGLTTIYDFSTSPVVQPMSSLIVGQGGALFGTTSSTISNGVAVSGGNYFRLTLAGVYTSLYTFNSTSGTGPQGRLVSDSSGNIYGTARDGGTGNFGTIFKFTSTGISVLHNFNESNGSLPNGGLTIIGSTLYGTTLSGGTSLLGTIFGISTSGGTLNTMFNFSGANGDSPIGELEVGSDGLLYGVTLKGGSSDQGILFRITTGSSFTKLVDFNGSNGREPAAGLLRAADNSLYGTVTKINGGEGAVIRWTSGGLTTPVIFSNTGGAQPRGGLAQDPTGEFYGTTYGGGTNGMGTVFRVNMQGSYTTVASFNGANGRDAWAGLVRAPDGNYYGTTYSGGTNDIGTVFRVTPAGVITTLVSFTGPNGSSPRARLTLGSDGNLYGNTLLGGATNQGTIFRVTTGGTFTMLASLNDTTGRNPRGHFVQATDGNLYCAMFQGGTGGVGTVTRLTPAGAVTAIAHFSSTTTGGRPVGGLIQGTDGNLYGTTSQGGTGLGGSVFRVTTAGVLTVLVQFSQNQGNSPLVGVVQGGDGNFYGATSLGSSLGFGELFRMTPAGVVTSIASFRSAGVSNELIRGTDGSFYSTTQLGGTLPSGQPAGAGMVYRLRLGPLAVTSGSQAVTSNSATVTGTVNPDGLATTATFQYGTDPTFAAFMTASAGSLSAGTATVPVQAALTGLLSGTQYFYRTAAQNAENPSAQVGSTLSFTTSAGVPDLDVEAPTGTAVVSGATLVFGESTTGQSVQRQVLIRSSGTAPLTGLAVMVEGVAAGDFSVSSLSTTSLVPSFSTGVVVTFTPTVAGTRVASLRITSNDPDENPFVVGLSGVGVSPLSPFQIWAAAAGLAGADAEPGASPYKDGVANLLKYAFNMNGAGPDVRVLGAADTAGLPWVRVDRSVVPGVLRLDFLRKKGSSLIYVAEVSETLGVFTPVTGGETLTNVDATWERVSISQPLSVARLFARVRVVQP